MANQDVRDKLIPGAYGSEEYSAVITTEGFPSHGITFKFNHSIFHEF